MTSPKPSLAVRLQRAITRLATLALLVAAGVIAAKYVFSERLDEGIRSRVEAELRRNYPGLEVHVKAARRIQGKGIEIRGLVISQPAAQGGEILLQVSEVLAECDTGFPDFVAQDPKFRHLHVRGMKVRAKRTANGTWNVAGLLPLPKQNGPSPPAEIKEATLELVDEHAGGSGSFVLRDIELSVNPQPQFKQPGNSLLSIKGSLGGDHLERIEIDALLDPVSGQWSLKGRVEGLEFNPRMRAALPSELSSILQPLASVRGRTQFGFQVTRGAINKRAADPPPVQFSIDGQIAEGRIDDSRLPEPLTDVTASIHCDNTLIRIDDLSARCGQTIVENLSAELRGYAANSPLSIRLIAKNIDLSRVPISSLPAVVRDAWARFGPQGRINLSGSITFDGRDWQPSLTAECLNLSLLYNQFPYRVGEGVGTIRLAKNHLSVNLRLVGGGQKLFCTAEIDNPGPNYLGWLELKSAGPLVLEDGIILAMEENAQNIVRDFNPRGHISFSGRVERNLERGTNLPRAVEHRHLNVQLHDMTIQHERFTYPIDKVTGKLEYRDGDWVFTNLAGRNDSASITGSGYWVGKATDGNQLSLTFRAHNVAIEEELRLALSSSVQNLWTNLRPRGTVDQLDVRMKFNPATAKFGVELDAHKRPDAPGGPVSIEPAWFRYRLDDLSGDFYYRDGVVTLANMEAVHGKTKFAADGTCRMAGGTSSLQLKRLIAYHIEFDQELLSALPRSLGSTLAKLSPAGQVNMDGSLGFALPSEEGASPQLDWNLLFVFSEGSLQAGLKVEHMDGEVRFIGHSDSRNLLCRGELDIASAMMNEIQVTSIKGPLLIDSEQLLAGVKVERGARTKAPRFITAKVFGDGELSLDGQLKFSPAGDFQIQASLDHADLATIVADLQPSVRGVTGKVYGTVNFGGTTEGVHTWRGEGQVKLQDANIYELPTMMSVLQVLSIQRPDRNAFTDSNMEFKIEGDDLEFTHLDLNGDVISLKGKGHVIGGRELQLQFYTQIGRDEFQIFRPLVGEMNRQFMLIEVTGPLEHPISRKTAFPKLNENLQQIFPELARDERPAPAPRSMFTAPREALERRGLIPKRK
ncbi:MAG: hypothetical protein ACKVP0_22470 [Pirellulaceae bacterium]